MGMFDIIVVGDRAFQCKDLWCKNYLITLSKDCKTFIVHVDYKENFEVSIQKAFAEHNIVVAEGYGFDIDEDQDYSEIYVLIMTEDLLFYKKKVPDGTLTKISKLEATGVE